MHQAAPTRERRLIASIARWFAARCTPAGGVRRSRGGVERAVAEPRLRAPLSRAVALPLAFAAALVLLLSGAEVGEAQTPAPGAPVITSVRPLDGALRVSWSAPSDGGTAIT